ncbi:peptidoglycan recognition protein family protein [Latilactobacillus curvatus]|uniref:peptidoglycan recognition protein family protein n=1 Tax=Latilactobacillus curvatus TaxID=28038 RepID=UPI00202DF3DD|nr:peptidoglycan recognition family protein [Latilactobacillus curvatus]MCM0725948.1 peptidoglycan recognition protein family protein [Latilactobacillus curvatus]
MNRKLTKFLIGFTMVSATFLFATNNVQAGQVLTPDEMKTQLNSQDTKEATPIKEKKAKTDDIGMPIDSSKVKKAIMPKAGYPSVNNYIYQHNYLHPNITQDLHTFSIFNYKTDDNRPNGVVVHYTDNPNNYSARSEADYEINGRWQSAFVHTFIDARTILNIHDTDYGAWGSGAVGNKYFAQFEMVTARNFEDFAKTTSYSAWYTAYLLNKYNLTPSLAQNHNGVGTIWSHHNVTQYLGGTDHTDPDAYFAKYGYDMNQFYALVQHYYDQMPANKASLNSVNVSENEIHVVGWHTAQQTANRPYSYLFLLDSKTHKEVKRYKINRVNRQDVHNIYENITNSLHSGFNNTLTLDNNMHNRSYVLMSRYSSDPNGNTDTVDFTFRNIIKVPKQETSVASMDSLTADKKTLSMSGWHASVDSSRYPYSYLIVINAKTGREYKRYAINRTQRDDVRQVYPNIANAGKSGFGLSIPVTNDMRGNTYKVISRYSSTPNGEGAYVDYSFDNQVTVPAIVKQNLGSIDTLTASFNNVHISGWQANDNAQGRNVHTLIVMDANTHKEIKRMTIANSPRNDVAAAYPDLYKAGLSGFSADIPVDSQLQGKNIYFISRYSATANADADYVDYQFINQIGVPKKQVIESAASMDQLSRVNNTVIMSGWHAANASINKPYSYLIIMDKTTNKEIRRYKINRSLRNDVAAVYPTLYGSKNSGFGLTFNIDNSLVNKRIYVISRYSDNPSGEGNTVDYVFDNALNI